ncbi:SRP40, C-terminal domain-containing protein, partial [Bipolaris maydis]
FQRIKPDTKVDPRLASNAYVSYDYADRAHAKLIVTKGKGFTKEKNKGKRGSYRGGMIDTSGGKGIKFDD